MLTNVLLSFVIILLLGIGDELHKLRVRTGGGPHAHY